MTDDALADPELLTYEQAAERLTVSPRTVQSLVYQRKLLSVKVGGARRVPASAVDEFIAAGIAAARRAISGDVG